MILTSTLRRLQGFAKDVRSEEGQAMVEYALLISLVAVVCFVAVQAFGLGVSHLYSKIDTDFP
jgi:pilus assembly protein Flp/PilA